MTRPILSSYGPPVGSCSEDERKYYYHRHYEYCYRHSVDLTWDEYLLRKRSPDQKKYGPPKGTKNGDRLTDAHRAYCKKIGKNIPWGEFEVIREADKRQKRNPVERNEWGEDPTFRRPIPEIIARINRLADIAMRR